MQKSLQSSQSAVGQHVLELWKQVKQDEERYNVSPDKLDANDIKKAKAVSVLALLAELPLATINSLSFDISPKYYCESTREPICFD